MLKKNILNFILLFILIICNSQTNKVDSLRGSFTYILKSKPNNLYPEKLYQEDFVLQISDSKSYFMSEKLIKFDSIFSAEFNSAVKNGITSIDFRGKSFPKTNSKFLIIQGNEQTYFYDKVDSSLLCYLTPKINEWKLVNEIKIINTLNCKKAELNYKGRNWIAWYSTDIPFPYGPYKFGGLPGLIVKIGIIDKINAFF